MKSYSSCLIFHLLDKWQVLASPFRQITSARTSQQEPPCSGALVRKEYLSLNSMIHPEIHTNLNSWHFPWEHALHSQHIYFEKDIRGPPPSVFAASCPNHAGISKKEMRADCGALLVQSRNCSIFQVGRKPQGVLSPTPNPDTFGQSKMKIPQLNRNKGTAVSQINLFSKKQLTCSTTACFFRKEIFSEQGNCF